MELIESGQIVFFLKPRFITSNVKALYNLDDDTIERQNQQQINKVQRRQSGENGIRHLIEDKGNGQRRHDTERRSQSEADIAMRFQKRTFCRADKLNDDNL